MGSKLSSLVLSSIVVLLTSCSTPYSAKTIKSDGTPSDRFTREEEIISVISSKKPLDKGQLRFNLRTLAGTDDNVGSLYPVYFPPSRITQVESSNSPPNTFTYQIKLEPDDFSTSEVYLANGYWTRVKNRSLVKKHFFSFIQGLEEQITEQFNLDTDIDVDYLSGSSFQRE